MLHRLLTILIILACVLHANGQSNSYNTSYEHGKHLLKGESYALAMQVLKPLAIADESNPKVVYASFYYGVAAYYAKDITQAKNMFQQVISKYPNWDSLDEVYYWAAKVGFETSGPFQGLMFSEKISTSNSPLYAQSKELSSRFLKNENIDALESLLSEYPKNKEVAFVLASKINKQEPREKDFERMQELILNYELDSTAFEAQINADVYKDKYSIGVFLPLFTDRVTANGNRLNKSFAVDMYEGMKMAIEDIDTTKIDVDLVVYDTKSNGDTTSLILKQNEVASLDAIIGPLYPEPSTLVSEFSYQHKINMLNPISANPEVIGENPFSFLYSSSASTLGSRAAQYITKAIDNKNAVVYYGDSPSDEIMARAYITELLKDSFNIVINEKIGKENTSIIYDVLAHTYEELDSVTISEMTLEEIEAAHKLPILEILTIAPDSIGHIFVASNSKVVAAEVLSAVTTRADSVQIPIVGQSDWLNFKDADLGMLEHMQVWMAASSTTMARHIEDDTFIGKYIYQHREYPSKFAFLGYRSMKFLAQSLQDYGLYFQNSFNKGLMTDTNHVFEESNDNQKSLMVRLQDGETLVLPEPQPEE